MEKICPRCNAVFTCQNHSIEKCWCFYEPVDGELLNYLAENFDGCICRDCMIEVRINISDNQKFKFNQS
jgi:hypothetical protein